MCQVLECVRLPGARTALFYMSVKLFNVNSAVRTSGGVSYNQEGTERVTVTKDALACFSELPPTPLNLVMIWGAARSGKSFFMNHLVRCESGNIFQVSGEFAACTVGADMSKTTVGLTEFRHPTAAGGCNTGTSPASSEPAIGFVDVEGQGDKRKGHEILLATPLLLLSQVRSSAGSLAAPVAR